MLYLLGLTFGEVLAGAGSILFAVVTLVFGWAILRGLLGFASLGMLFSNNVEPTGLFRLLFRPTVS